MINMNHTRDKYQHIGVVRVMYYIGILAVGWCHRKAMMGTGWDETAFCLR